MQKLSRHSGNSSGNVETLSKLSYNMETFHKVQKHSRKSEKFADNPETFRTIRKPSRQSGNFLDNLATF